MASIFQRNGRWYASYKGPKGWAKKVVGRDKAAAERIARIGRNIDLEVDGGITPETAKLARDAGANLLVAGTSVFRGGSASYAANIRALRG